MTTDTLTEGARIKQARRVTWIGIYWNVFLVITKFVAGIVGKSSALVADAVHSLSDFAGDIAILAGLKIAGKPVDETHNYGHGKFETLSNIFISLLLILVGIGIFWNGISNIVEHFQGQHVDRPTWLALLIVVFSIVIKEGLYQYTVRQGHALNSPALITNAWHHRTDAFSSVAVLFGVSGAMFLGERWLVLDPLAAVAVSIFIFKVGFGFLYESMNELMEASLSAEHREEILNIVDDVPGAKFPHNLRTRKIGNTVAIDMHIKVNPRLSIVEAHDIATQVEDRLKAVYGETAFISIHVEPDSNS
ncbi:MAG TPA: cation transporter [Caldithrix abyssi]|uniref:Cation transporter n=1 Tax=Caldithrix abyssi TaxID=187145 RepID=A0A7V4U0W3_CALAY|nr:cation transporter [Caldithrix abyssi]